MIADQLEMKRNFEDTGPDGEMISSTDICGPPEDVDDSSTETLNEGVTCMTQPLYGGNYGILPINQVPGQFGTPPPPIIMSSIPQALEDVIRRDQHLNAAVELLNDHINNFYTIANRMTDRQLTSEIIRSIESLKSIYESLVLRAEERVQWQRRFDALTLPLSIPCDLRLFKTAYAFVRLFSKDKKVYFWYHPFAKGIFELPTITPDDPPFDALAKDAYVTIDRLEKEDAFSLVSVFCAGSDSLPVTVKTNPVYIRPSISISNVVGDNVQIFMDTGMSIFSSRNDAERCMKESGDSIRQYMNSLMKKEQAKTEVTGLKTAVRDTIIATVAGLVTLAGREIIGSLTHKK